MRIACVHIPQFALQCATRLDPSLRGAAVAVVSGVEPGRERAGVLHAPIVLACSRMAWALGVRLGMTATAARGLSPALQLVAAEPVQEREAVRAVADSLLALTPIVDLGGRVGAGGAHLAMYVDVPAKTRGASFGDRLVELLEQIGFAARIGIADDRFTAWVAAAHAGNSSDGDDRSVVSVPRGGSAAFLSPRPLALLAITPEVQHMLEALGVRTLGEFASLPAPSVARPLEADYQALARGESGAQLRPYAPDAPIREDVVVTAGNVLQRDGALGGPAAIALIALRIALRLAGRRRAAARVEVGALAARPEIGSRDGLAMELTDIPVQIDHAVTAADDVARTLRPVLDPNTNPIVDPSASASGGERTWRLRVMVSGEALVDSNGEVTEAFAEGSSPFARVAASRTPSNTNDSIYAKDPSELRDLSGDSLSAVAHHESGLSPLAVVLSSTGALFALSSPSASASAHAERRDAHRRTRRGKQRRNRPTAPMQPRLFDRSSSKS